jgi:hypothetical protein
MGVRIFAEAYLHAFAYLLSPCTPGERALYYPNIAERVNYLQRTANALGVELPADFVDCFDSEDEPTEPIKKLLVSAADMASASLVDAIITEAADFADSKSLPKRSNAQVSKIVTDYRMVVPAVGPATMTDILNAGWSCYHQADLWSEVRQIKSEDRTRILHDLILKSFEVTEVHERVHGP